MAAGELFPLPQPDPVVEPQPDPRRKVDSANTTRERAELTIFADGTAVQHWIIKDEAGAVVGREAFSMTQAEVNAMMDNPSEKVTGTDATKRTPLRHIRREIQELRQANRQRVVRTYTEPLVDIV